MRHVRRSALALVAMIVLALLAALPAAAQVQQPDIVGGETTVPGQVPYQARVMTDAVLVSLNCGGSLIHPEWV